MQSIILPTVAGSADYGGFGKVAEFSPTCPGTGTGDSLFVVQKEFLEGKTTPNMQENRHCETPKIVLLIEPPSEDKN